MKIFLIEHQPTQFILCSDEEIKVNDWYNSNLGINKLGETTRNIEQYRQKIIAGYDNLPKLSFTDEVAKEIGYVNVEKLAKKEYRDYYSDKDYKNLIIEGFIDGFEKALELTQHKYTEQDLVFMYNQGVLAMRQYIDSYDNCKKHIQSLQQPRMWEVEVGMESNNTITVTKIIK